jgi:hypothetical protein
LTCATSQTKGWLRFRDPITHRCDDVWARDIPAWKAILVKQLREDGWHPRQQDAADDDGMQFSCGCLQEHEPRMLGLGLDCLNGNTCTNPHHSAHYDVRCARQWRARTADIQARARALP